ncbi:MAG TPA: hypothetical protein VN253_27760 [Kofleriaceae bacterium]|nr:hypothetical protein [Kofleriaceae bacterium]
MRLFTLIAPTVLATLLFWSALAACLDHPSFESPPTARIVVQWDPLACGSPHRIAVELEDEDGTPLSSSVPCALGGLAIQAPHFGVYLGRVYAWTAGAPIRSVTPVRLYVDEPIVRWVVATPE